MSDATADAAEDLSNAAANLQISIGQQINPLVEKLYGMGANALNFMTEFTQEHPVAVKAVTAVAIGLGAVAVAIAGIGIASVALKTAIPAVISFGTAVNTALGPIGWIAMGISALVVAGGALIAMLDSAEDETEGMTAVTRAQYYELQSLNGEYERACEQYGETSDEALRLQYQVDDLSAAFGANRQAVEEFTAEVDALCESVHSVTDDFNSALTEINAQETGTLALIQKYEDLATQIDRTDAEQAALEAVTKKRTASYPKLAEQLENASMSADDFVEAMKRACEQQAEQQRQQEAQEATDSTLTYEQAVSTAYESVRAEVEELCAAYDKAYQSALESFEGQFGLFDEAAANMESTVANAQAALDSQLAYWESYNTNLETLTAYGETLTGDARANTSTTTAVSVEANASGTTNAGDIFIAGEDGPELIVGKAGRQYEWGHYGSDRAALEQDLLERVENYQQQFSVKVAQIEAPGLYKYYSTQRPVDIGTFPKTS